VFVLSVFNILAKNEAGFGPYLTTTRKSSACLGDNQNDTRCLIIVDMLVLWR